MSVRLRKLGALPTDLYLALICNFPGALGYKLRSGFWKRRLKYLGKNVLIDCGVYFQNPKYISIADNAWIDRGVVILAGPDESDRQKRRLKNLDYPLSGGEVYIGKNVHIAPYCIVSGISGVYVSDNCCFSASVKVYSFSHHYRSDKMPGDIRFNFGSRVFHNRQMMIEGPIFIGANVGIALNAVLLPGISIHKNSFVSINSVVTKSFEANSFISGNPAQRIKARFEN